MALLQSAGPPRLGFLLTGHWSLVTVFLAVGGIVRPVLRDLLLVPIADRQQHRLGVDEIPAPLARYSKMLVSTMESTGHDSSHNPQKMHLVRSMS
jgi:hypothetical protein